jgi:hypothetical protein
VTTKHPAFVDLLGVERTSLRGETLLHAALGKIGNR